MTAATEAARTFQPPLQFSGHPSFPVEEFVAVLDAELTHAPRVPRALVPGLLASRLTGRARLWYTETLKTHHFKLSPDGFWDLRARLVETFSLRDAGGAGADPRRAFRALTQYTGSVRAYAERFAAAGRALSPAFDADALYHRLWWVHGLRAEIRDTLFEFLPHAGSFDELVLEAMRVETAVAEQAEANGRSGCCCRCKAEPSAGDAEQEADLKATEETRSEASEDVNEEAKAMPQPRVDGEMVKLFGELLKAQLLSSTSTS